VSAFVTKPYIQSDDAKGLLTTATELMDKSPLL
ncbi:hypothetical protein LCGC14_0642670, partial [marine sediment metagenome]